MRSQIADLRWEEEDQIWALFEYYVINHFCE
jgi:hypothetical protein